MNKLFRIYCLLLIAFLAACKTDKSKFYVYANTGDIDWSEQYVAYGKSVQLTLHAESDDAPIERLTLSSYDKQYLEQSWLDTIFVQERQTLDIPLRITPPAYQDTTDVSFTLTGSTISGKQTTYSFTLFMLPASLRLRENDAITLYSARSAKPSAFSVATMSVVYPADAKGLSFQDMLTTDSIHSEHLSRSWISDTGLYFADGGDFSYGTATTSALMQAYRNSQHLSIITGLHNEQIILIGTATNAVAVVKIINIFDEAGTEDDRYQFSIKVIQ